MKPVDIARLCSHYWKSENLILAVAVCLGESDGKEYAHYVNDATGDDSWGLLMVNMRGAMGAERRKRYGLKSNTDLLDPATNVRVAYDIWATQGHGSFKPWGAFTDGGFKKYGRYEIAKKAVLEVEGGNVSWKPAPCISQLIREANTLAPNRSKASDGTIGDTAHAGTTSDHNPDSRGIVHAVDLTHDPRGGWDCNARVRQILEKRDRRVKYMLWAGAMYRSYSKPGIPPWTPDRSKDWGHHHHMHVSVQSGAIENDVSPWFGEEDEVTDADLKKITAVMEKIAIRAVARIVDGPNAVYDAKEYTQKPLRPELDAIRADVAAIKKNLGA